MKREKEKETRRKKAKLRLGNKGSCDYVQNLRVVTRI